LTPAAEHECLVCTGTACHVNGAAQLLADLQADPLSDLGVELGSVRCIGTCSDAPLVVIDGTVWNHATAEAVLERLRELRP
jgi:bidirectional [NiFe] hydrogenase diaphorase subunit